MRPIIIFSTITGNGFKIASAASKAFDNPLGPYNIRYINNEVIEKFDTFILCYWCNHGTADDDTIDLIKKLKNKNLIILGTLGVKTDTLHAQKVLKNVEDLATENNRLICNFICQGSIDLNRTSQRLKIPKGEKGHLTQERFERQKLSQGHPNEEELNAATQAVKEAMENLETLRNVENR